MRAYSAQSASPRGAGTVALRWVEYPSRQSFSPTSPLDGVAGTGGTTVGKWNDPKKPLDFYREAEITLEPGTNAVGFWTVGGPGSTAPCDYVNFQYFNITFTASVDNPPQPARWDWDFGDGTKDEEGRRRREPVTQLQG